ncbi:tetratricopeptide repeat protein [candidate division TA06 bacterium]|nr:tetratricopeptide repeat protein [candidate division TA06 bacterium]
MNNLDGWIIGNVREARAGGRLEQGIPFAIWQRQWDICDLSGNRARSRVIAENMSGLARRHPRYAVTDRLYNAKIHFYSGEYAKALELSQEALLLSRQDEDDPRLPDIYVQLSQSHQSLSNFEKALEYQAQAAGLYRSKGDQISLGNSLANSGLI